MHDRSITYHSNRGKISLEDAIVIKVLQPDGKTWANRGMTVEEFLHHPWVDPKTGQKMRTPAERVAFLRRVTNRPVAKEIEEKVKSTVILRNQEGFLDKVLERSCLAGGEVFMKVPDRALKKQNP